MEKPSVRNRLRSIAKYGPNMQLHAEKQFHMRQMDTVLFWMARTRVVDHISAFSSQDARMHICIQSASERRKMPAYSAGIVFDTF